VTPATVLILALLACYGLTSLALSVLVAVAQSCGLVRDGWRAESYLTLRLTPSAGALLLTLCVALPAFMQHEPRTDQELAGPVLLLIAGLSLAAIADGLFRGWRACAAASSLRRRLSSQNVTTDVAGKLVRLVCVESPLIAVLGVWRQRIYVSRSAWESFGCDEFRQAVAHEVAHMTTRDNLKALLLHGSPDFLARFPVASTLARCWRRAAEYEADDRATGADRSARLALASALVKAARLASKSPIALPELSASIIAGEVEARVRRLLLPLSTEPRSYRRSYAIAVAFVIPIVATPGYEAIHECIERIVGIGR
jgi:Zn-dependent protease with chaperone function